MLSLSQHVIGAFLGIIAAISLSIAALAIRAGSSTDDGSSFDALLVVLTTNVVLLTPVALVTYYPDYGLSPRSVVAFVIAGLVGTGSARMGYYKSIELVGASRAEPVKSSMPLYATIFAVVVLGEVVSPLRWVGIGIIIVGIAIISLDLSDGDGLKEFRGVSMTGFFLGVSAAVLFGLEPVFAKIGLSEGTPSMVGLFIKTVTAAGFFFAYAVLRDRFKFDRLQRGSEWIWYVVAGVGNTAFLAAYYSGLAISPVSVVTPLMQTSPLFVALMSYLFFSDLERVTRYVASGVVLVAVGGVLITIAG